MLKTLDLEMGRLSRIIQLGPKCSHIYPYIRKAMEGMTYAKEKVIWIWNKEILSRYWPSILE